MDIQITARGFTASSNLHDYVQTRLQKLTRFYDGITSARVVLTEEGNVKSTEITLSVYRDVLSTATDKGDFEAMIDNCTDRLRRQLLRYKDRLRRTDQYVH
ncbi:MAG: ribosome-associated translation inhibitor RaiA [Bacteroidota bacterium]